MSQLHMQRRKKQTPAEPHHDFLSLVNMLVISAQPQLFSAHAHIHTHTQQAPPIPKTPRPPFLHAKPDIIQNGKRGHKWA